MGKVILEKGIVGDVEKIKSMSKWVVARNVIDVKYSMEFVGYYRRFIE